MMKMNQTLIRLHFFCRFLLIGCGICFTVFTLAESYIERMNLQSRVHNAAGQPVPDGDYDVTIRYFTGVNSGDEILVETHEASGSGAAAVSDGILNLILGTGDIQDGSGPGVYTQLNEIFADYNSVWIEFEFQGEVIPERSPLTTSAWAIDTLTLDGLSVDDFGSGYSLDASDGDPENAVIVDAEGRVGIGIQTPQALLHVRSVSDGGLMIDTAEGFTANLLLRKDGSNYWNISSDENGFFRIKESGVANRLLIAEGHVGINESMPQYDLDLGGDLHLLDSILDSNGSSGSDGQVLTSTGSSVLWADMPVFSDGDWTVDGNDMYFPLNGHVGIGTNSPGCLLTAAGPRSDTPGSGHLLRLQYENNSNHAFGFRLGDTGGQNLFLDSYYGGWQPILTVNREYGRLGLNTETTTNMLDVSGKMVIGSTYAGAESAPGQGLLVEGAVGVGTQNVFSYYGMFVNGDIGLDGDRQISYQSGSTGMLVQLWSSGFGLGINSGELFSSASVAHSYRKAPDGFEAMKLTLGSDGGLNVFGTGESCFMGNLGLDTGSPKNRLDVSGKMAAGSNLAGIENAPDNGLLVEMFFGVGGLEGYHLNIKGGNMLCENSSGHDKLDLGLNSDGAGYLQTYGDPSTRNIVITSEDEHPNYGAISVYDNSGITTLDFLAFPLDFGQIDAFGPAGTKNTSCACIYPNIGYGAMTVCDPTGNPQASMIVDLFGDGVVSADYKWLKWDDPDDPGREIQYGCLEGPEAAAYARGTAQLNQGLAYVEFPEHFQSVASQNTTTIQLTPLDASSRGLAVADKNHDGFTVKELKSGAGTYAFDWEVKCTRKGFEDYQVIRNVRERN